MEVPQNQKGNILIGGDWNIDIHKDTRLKEKLLKAASLLKLHLIEPNNPTRQDATIDFILAGEKIELANIETQNSPSDHKALLFSIKVNRPFPPKLIKIPNKRLAEIISQTALDNSNGDLANFKNLH